MHQYFIISVLNCISIACLSIASIQDARKREVSNWISIVILTTAMILMIVREKFDLSGIIPGVIMATLYLLGFDKQFRGADVKLLFALGLYLSLVGCLMMLFIASLAALIYEGIRYVITHEKRKYLPFCTWMGIAGTVILAVQII